MAAPPGGAPRGWLAARFGSRHNFQTRQVWRDAPDLIKLLAGLHTDGPPNVEQM